MNGKTEAQNLTTGDLVILGDAMGYTYGIQNNGGPATFIDVIDINTGRKLTRVWGTHFKALVTVVNPEVVHASEIVIDGRTFQLPKGHPVRKRLVAKDIEMDRLRNRLGI